MMRSFMGMPLNQLSGVGTEVKIAVGDIVMEDTRNGENVFIVIEDMKQWKLIPIVTNGLGIPFFHSIHELHDYIKCNLEVIAVYRPVVATSSMFLYQKLTNKALLKLVKGYALFRCYI